MESNGKWYFSMLLFNPLLRYTIYISAVGNFVIPSFLASSTLFRLIGLSNLKL